MKTMGTMATVKSLGYVTSDRHRVSMLSSIRLPLPLPDKMDLMNLMHLMELMEFATHPISPSCAPAPG